MMLRTGNNLSFTLVEVMAATCILALGTVLVYESFFVTVDLFGYYSNYMKVAPLADEKIWELENSLSRLSLASPPETAIAADSRFQWDASFNQIDAREEKMKLYQVNVSCSWRQGKRLVTLSRNGYALYKKPEN